MKEADTGADPLGSWKEFIKTDTTINIDVHRDNFKRLDDLESRKPYPAIGCMKKSVRCRFLAEINWPQFRKNKFVITRRYRHSKKLKNSARSRLKIY